MLEFFILLLGCTVIGLTFDNIQTCVFGGMIWGGVTALFFRAV